jgi:hypothetical protein
MKYVLRVFSEKKKKFANRKLDLWSVLLTVYREGLLLDLTLRVRRTGLDWIGHPQVTRFGWCTRRYY